MKTMSGQGKLDVLTSKTQASGSATIRVLMLYNNEDIFDQILTLRLSRPGGENGIGLFVRRFLLSGNMELSCTFKDPIGIRGREDRVALEFTVILPESSTPYKIRKFETDVSNTSQRIHDLHGKISFESISLHGSNAQIHVEVRNTFGEKCRPFINRREHNFSR